MKPLSVDGLLVIRDERIAFASSGVAAMLGLPADELVGRRFEEFLPAAERGVIVERHRRRLLGEAQERRRAEAEILPSAEALVRRLRDDGLIEP